MSSKGRPAADAGISIGQVYLGKYRVDAILGHGGMGVVAKCTHLGLNDPVAMKMLRQDVLLDRDATERFMREAQAASKLRSEHVARVVDVGTFHDSGVPYMVMEFLDGHDLGELLDQRGSIPVPWASMLVLQAAEALAEAHAIGIVHRDVKPTNLFVTWRPDGSAIIKVLDFGISKSPMGTDMQLTQTQSLLGTPAYMSPEQMRSARLVDQRTDIWSLGIVFYELLEGRRPFEAESFSEMCVKVAVDPPAPMTNAPPALQQIVFRCLAKSPEQRYGSMAELGRDLLPFVNEQHQGTLLVERMQRMQGRRSSLDVSSVTPIPWHPETPAAGTPPPWQPDGAVPTPAPWQGDQSAAIAVPGRRAPTPVSGVATTTIPDPARARAASELTMAPARRRWLPVAIAGAVAACGITLGVWLARDSGSDDDERTRVIAPEPRQDPPKQDPPKQDPPTQDPPKQDPPKQATKAPDLKGDQGGEEIEIDPIDPKPDDVKVIAPNDCPPKRRLPNGTCADKDPPPKKDPPQLKKDPPAPYCPPARRLPNGKCSKEPPPKKDPPELKKDPPSNACPPMRRLPGGKCSDV